MITVLNNKVLKISEIEEVSIVSILFEYEDIKIFLIKFKY